MVYNPPVRGTFKKPVPKSRDPLSEIDELKRTTKQIVVDLDTVKKTKIASVEKKVEELSKATSEAGKRATVALNDIQATKKQVLEIVGDIQDGEPGTPGQDAEPIDEDALIRKILSQIPEPDELNFEELVKKVIAELPKQEPVDLKKLKTDILKSLPKKKGDLRIITEKVEIDPMSVIEKIMALPADKFKLKLDNIDGLDQTMKAFRSQLGRGYLHGGGDTVKAGTGITLTKNSDGTKTISSTATGGVSQIIAGTNITISPVGGTGAVTINATGGGSQTPWTSDINATNFSLLNLNRLGIGTTTPQSSIDIRGASGSLAEIRLIDNASSSAGSRIRLDSSNAGGSVWVLGTGKTGDTNGADSFYLKNFITDAVNLSASYAGVLTLNPSGGDVKVTQLAGAGSGLVSVDNNGKLSWFDISGSQTPWTSSINGGGYNLTNVVTVGSAGQTVLYGDGSNLTGVLHSFTETDPLSFHLNQTSPQTLSGGAFAGSGLLKLTSGLLGVDTNTYYKSGDSPTFGNITDSGLTITRIPFAGTAGLLTDSANLTWDNTNNILTAPTVVATTAITAPIVGSASGGIDIYVMAMLHLDNNVTDSSMSPITFTNSGVTFANTSPKFSYYGVFNGSSHLTTSPGSFNNFGLGDFCIDFWCKTTQSGGSYYAMVGSTGSGVGHWRVSNIFGGTQEISLNFYDGGYIDIPTGVSISDGNWHHVEVDRSGGVFYFFKDGTLIYTDASHTTKNVGSASYGYDIGYNPANSTYYNGQLDEIRITKGLARHTTSFTVPVAPYTTGTIAVFYGDGSHMTNLPATGVPTSRNITINGNTQNLSTDVSWSIPVYNSNGSGGDIQIADGYGGFTNASYDVLNWDDYNQILNTQNITIQGNIQAGGMPSSDQYDGQTLWCDPGDLIVRRST